MKSTENYIKLTLNFYYRKFDQIYFRFLLANEIKNEDKNSKIFKSK